MDFLLRRDFEQKERGENDYEKQRADSEQFENRAMAPSEERLRFLAKPAALELQVCRET